jgi:hypothetical protein
MGAAQLTAARLIGVEEERLVDVFGEPLPGFRFVGNAAEEDRERDPLGVAVAELSREERISS